MYHFLFWSGPKEPREQENWTPSLLFVVFKCLCDWFGTSNFRGVDVTCCDAKKDAVSGANISVVWLCWGINCVCRIFQCYISVIIEEDKCDFPDESFFIVLETLWGSQLCLIKLSTLSLMLLLKLLDANKTNVIGIRVIWDHIESLMWSKTLVETQCEIFWSWEHLLRDTVLEFHDEIFNF